jgi:hypothetical protein
MKWGSDGGFQLKGTAVLDLFERSHARAKESDRLGDNSPHLFAEVVRMKAASAPQNKTTILKRQNQIVPEISCNVFPSVFRDSFEPNNFFLTFDRERE